MPTPPTIAGVAYLGHVPADEFRARIARSQGYAAGYDRLPAVPGECPEAYLQGWHAGNAINLERPATARPAPRPAPVATDFKLESPHGHDHPRPAAVRRDPQDSAGQARQLDRVPIAEEKPVLCPDRTGGDPAQGLAARHVDQHRAIDFKHCGIVVIVDFLNILVRSFHASPPSLINGVRGMLDTLVGVIDRLSPEYLIFALDGGYTHRTKLYPDYKAHRGEKPPGLAEQIQLGEQVLEALGWPAIRVIGWEADDVIASLATQLDDVAIGTVVISSDKDLTQLLATTSARISQPWGGGSFTNEKTCQEKFGVSSKQLGDYLALVGDASDGVPGVKGIGPKKAAELLAKYGNLDGILEAARILAIPGAAGKALREQTALARLSRELVTLHADLPVGRHWSAWPLREPRGGWKQKLTAMGLGGPAQRLTERIPLGEPRDDASALEIEWITLDLPATSDCVQPVADPKPDELPAAAALDVETWYPNLAACPPNATLLDKVRAVYRTGLDHHQAGRDVRNSWNRDSAYWAAFQDGITGAPLTVDLADYDSAGVWIEQPSKPLAEQPAAVLSLF